MRCFIVKMFMFNLDMTYIKPAFAVQGLFTFEFDVQGMVQNRHAQHAVCGPNVARKSFLFGPLSPKLFVFCKFGRNILQMRK